MIPIKCIHTKELKELATKIDSLAEAIETLHTEFFKVKEEEEKEKEKRDAELAKKIAKRSNVNIESINAFDPDLTIYKSFPISSSIGFQDWSESYTDDFLEISSSRRRYEVRRKLGELSKEIEKTFSKIHYEILQIVTSGQYILKENKFNEILDEIVEQKFNNLDLCYDNLATDLKFKNIFLKNERDFLSEIRRKLRYLHSFHTRGLNVYYIDKSIREVDKSAHTSRQWLIASINLELIDIEITVKKNPRDLLYELISLYDIFKQNKKKLSVQRFKAIFLINKIYVFITTRTGDFSDNYISSENKTLKEVIKDEIKEFPSDLKDLTKIVKIYDYDKVSESENQNKLEKILSRNLKRESLQSYVNIKIFKDSSGEFNNTDLFIENLKKITTLIRSYEVTTNQHSYDFQADRINFIFLFNNFVSYLDDYIKWFVKIGSRINGLDDWLLEVEDFLKIVKEHENTCPDIENYFTYYKLSCLYLSLSRYYLMISRIGNHDKDELNNLIQKAKSYHARTCDSQKILGKKFYTVRKFHRFRLRFEESCFVVDENKGFIYSSINLPLYFYEQEQRNTELKEYTFENYVDIENLDTDIRIENSFEQSVNDIDKVKKEVDNKAKEQVFRSTEILSIFAAIVVFASGSIQLFKQMESFGDAVIILTIFAFFVTSTFLIVSTFMSSLDFKKKIKNFLAIFVVLLVAYTVLIGVVNWHNAPLSGGTILKDISVNINQTTNEMIEKKPNSSLKQKQSKSNESSIKQLNKPLK